MVLIFLYRFATTQYDYITVYYDAQHITDKSINKFWKYTFKYGLFLVQIKNINKCILLLIDFGLFKTGRRLLYAVREGRAGRCSGRILRPR
jgi:hypothetical protein